MRHIICYVFLLNVKNVSSENTGVYEQLNRKINIRKYVNANIHLADFRFGSRTKEARNAA